MNCQEWEERIALYATGDAGAGEGADIERHIAGCAGCRVFLSEQKQSLEWLREAHQEEIAPAHYAAVRARVMGELESGRAPWWKRVWVAGLGLAAVTAAVVVLTMARPHPVGPPLAAMKPAEGEISADAGQGAGSRPGGLPQRVVGRRKQQTPLSDVRGSDGLHREVGRRKRLPHRQAETILVKLETDNPDVVIYWIAERKGD